MDPESAKRQVNQILIECPDGRELTDEELVPCWRRYGIDLWERVE